MDERNPPAQEGREHTSDLRRVELSSRCAEPGDAEHPPIENGLLGRLTEPEDSHDDERYRRRPQDQNIRRQGI